MDNSTSVVNHKFDVEYTIQQRMLIRCRQLNFDNESQIHCEKLNFDTESQIRYKTQFGRDC